MSIITKLQELDNKINSDKTLLASAITNKGISTASSDSLETMASKISQIEQNSGGGLEPGSKILASKIIQPEEVVIQNCQDVTNTSRYTTRFCIDIGEDIIYTTYLGVTSTRLLYSFNKITKECTRRLNNYTWFENCYYDKEKQLLIFVTAKSSSSSSKYIVITDLNFSIKKEILLTSYYSSISGSSICSNIKKYKNNYYILYSYSTASANFIIKMSCDDYSITAKSINSITSNTNGYYFGLSIYNDNLYILGYKDLVRINTDFELIEISTDLCGNSSLFYYWSIINIGDYIYVRRYNSNGIYKINPNDLTDYSIVCEEYIFGSFNIYHGKKYSYYTGTTSNPILNILDYNNDFNLIKQIKFNYMILSVIEVNDKLLLHDSNFNTYCYNIETLEEEWRVNQLFNKDTVRPTTSTNISNTLNLIELYQFAHVIDDEIYLFRTGVTKIPLNPVYTVK